MSVISGGLLQVVRRSTLDHFNIHSLEASWPVMADAQTLIANDAVGPTKASESQFASVAASAGIPAEPVPVEGRLGAPRINARVTGEPVLGQPQFFPANPMMVEKLAADNKDVKQISTGDRTSSGGILRTISDVITELRSKRQNNKRVGLSI